MTALSLLARLRRFVGNRRISPRLPVEVNAHLVVLLPEVKISIEGQTRDLSRTGLALMLPETSLYPEHIRLEDCKIEVEMTLPTGRIELEAIPVRHRRVDLEDSGKALFIGAYIVRIGDIDRARLTGYLEIL